ncbi:Integrin alpha-PS5 [Armadillidium nasatum]|uniref:Integrin alpha-PS5 n=1 Tax=Armadillidium nasatum TaxID=96803 RepID=A0A5N5TJZ9_9CRUS|nr:Integrin alpha-PS5 [Armadillidium nasatum]
MDALHLILICNSFRHLFTIKWIEILNTGNVLGKNSILAKSLVKQVRDSFPLEKAFLQKLSARSLTGMILFGCLTCTWDTQLKKDTSMDKMASPSECQELRKFRVRTTGENFVVNPMVTIHVRGEKTLQLWTTLSPPRNEFGLLDSDLEQFLISGSISDTYIKEVFYNVWLFSYFGYSVTVADVDGNELDDVIIGAPFYHNETNYDQGAILVYLQFKKEEKGADNQHYYMSLESSKSLRVGLTDQGRFGSSVSNVKDLDGDGIDDIAVGAPFAENGYVYIYLGSPEGLSEIPHQVKSCEPWTILSGGRNLKGFGSSFASINPSSNSVKQKDLAIGAFPSDAVVIIKSKVMISVDWDVDFPSKMDLKSKYVNFTK